MEEIAQKESSPGPERQPYAIEREILELEQRLAEKKKELEVTAPPPKEKLGSRPATPAPSAPIKPAPPKKKSLIAANPKVKVLVDKAFREGISKAVEEVKKTNDAYLIDAFHDALVDEVYSLLVKEGLLKEI